MVFGSVNGWHLPAGTKPYLLAPQLVRIGGPTPTPRRRDDASGYAWRDRAEEEESDARAKREPAIAREAVEARQRPPPRGRALSQRSSRAHRAFRAPKAHLRAGGSGEAEREVTRP